jgi:phosphohistidine phosphatase
MRLYLVQHGEAKPEAEDPERPLTLSGTEEVKRVAGMLRKLQIKQPKIVHSGKVRAKQTAEILAQGLNISLSLVQGSPVLNPNDPVRPWAERIQKELDDLMLVGHLPFLEKLASLLLCGNENAKLVLFRYGAIVCLEQKEDKAWAIRWVLTPEMC